MPLPAFKAYDIRGRVPDELDDDLARRIGVALAARLGDGPVVLGHDVRLSSPGLQAALSAGLRSQGREVIDIGLCGTEEVYFQVDHLDAAGGVMVTASHNPMDYNGMKLVKEHARPISSDTGLLAISDAVQADTAGDSYDRARCAEAQNTGNAFLMQQFCSAWEIRGTTTNGRTAQKGLSLEEMNCASSNESNKILCAAKGRI